MKKINILALAVCAVFAFGAIAATSAFAEETELLISGATAKAGELLDSEGELLVADRKGGPFGEELKVLCSLANLDEVLTPTDFDITAVYSLVESDPEGAGLIECTRQVGICPIPVMIDPVNLPWLVTLELVGAMLTGSLLNGGNGAPGYAISCGGIAEDECTFETKVKLTQNAGGTFLLEFVGLLGTPGNCSRGGAKEMIIEGDITFLSVEEGLAAELMGA